jgi:flagellar basal body-associated protein FliL
MAEEKPKTEEEAAPPKSKKKLVIGGVVFGVMVLEAVAVFVIVKMVGGGKPDTVAAAQHADAPPADAHAAPADTHGDAHGDGHGDSGGDGHGEPAGDGHGDAAVHTTGDAEVELAEIQAPNLKSGRTYVYDLAMVARVRSSNVARFKTLKQQKENEIKARLTEIIRCASPEHLKEDRLQTIRRQALHVLSEVLGEAGLVEDIMITRWMVFLAE